MITQEIIDKLKANEIPYGILRTKDWFTDEVDKFMKDNITFLICYGTDSVWTDKENNVLYNDSTYRLRQDYVLSNKEVYDLLPINHDEYSYFINQGKDISEDLEVVKTNTRFLGFWFGTEADFYERINNNNNNWSDIIGLIMNEYSIPRTTDKIERLFAKYVIMKGKDYE